MGRSLLVENISLTTGIDHVVMPSEAGRWFVYSMETIMWQAWMIASLFQLTSVPKWFTTVMNKQCVQMYLDLSTVHVYQDGEEMEPSVKTVRKKTKIIERGTNFIICSMAVEVTWKAEGPQTWKLSTSNKEMMVIRIVDWVFFFYEQLMSAWKICTIAMTMRTALTSRELSTAPAILVTVEVALPVKTVSSRLVNVYLNSYSSSFFGSFFR